MRSSSSNRRSLCRIKLLNRKLFLSSILTPHSRLLKLSRWRPIPARTPPCSICGPMIHSLNSQPMHHLISISRNHRKRESEKLKTRSRTCSEYPRRSWELTPGRSQCRSWIVLGWRRGLLRRMKTWAENWRHQQSLETTFRAQSATLTWRSSPIRLRTSWVIIGGLEMPRTNQGRTRSNRVSDEGLSTNRLLLRLRRRLRYQLQLGRSTGGWDLFSKLICFLMSRITQNQLLNLRSRSRLWRSDRTPLLIIQRRRTPIYWPSSDRRAGRKKLRVRELSMCLNQLLSTNDNLSQSNLCWNLLRKQNLLLLKMRSCSHQVNLHLTTESSRPNWTISCRRSNKPLIKSSS